MEFAKTPLPSSISVRSVMTAYHLPPHGRVKGGEAHWFLELAKKLLANDYGITETADRPGFSSVHYFSRLFKKKEGISPSEYKSRAR